MKTHRRCHRCGTNLNITGYPVFYTSRAGTGWVSRHCGSCLEFSGMEAECDALEEELKMKEEEMTLLKEQIRELRGAIRSINRKTWTAGEDE